MKLWIIWMQIIRVKPKWDSDRKFNRDLISELPVFCGVPSLCAMAVELKRGVIGTTLAASGEVEWKALL